MEILEFELCLAFMIWMYYFVRMIADEYEKVVVI